MKPNPKRPPERLVRLWGEWNTLDWQISRERDRRTKDALRAKRDRLADEIQDLEARLKRG